MNEPNVNSEEVGAELDDELEPKVLAPISDVTGSSPGDWADDYGNVVWGNQ